MDVIYLKYLDGGHILHAGIDPWRGIAVWDSSKKHFAVIRTMKKFWDLMHFLNILLRIKQRDNYVYVWVEAPHENRFLYAKRTQSGIVRDNIAINIGENHFAAKLIIQWCQLYGLPVTPVKPTKNTITKISSSQFKTITGYTGMTSEHGRDAAMLVYDR